MSFSDYVDKSREKKEQKQESQIVGNLSLLGKIWTNLVGFFLKEKSSQSSDKTFFSLKEEISTERKDDVPENPDVSTQEIILEDLCGIENEIQKNHLELEDLKRIITPQKNLSKKINIELYACNGYLTLFLYPPNDGVEFVSIVDTFLSVNSLLLQYGIRKPEKELKDYLNRALREPISLSLKLVQPDLTRDSILIFSFFENNCRSFLEITKPHLGGAKFSLEEVRSAITKKKIVYGVLEDSVMLAVKKEIYGKKILIASGVEPIHGEDEKLDYKVSIQGKGIAKIKEDGTINFREINFTTNVVKGQVLVEKISFASIKDGCDIFGKKILGKVGKTVKLLPGKNVAISEDGTKLIALSNGNVVKSKVNNQISIEDVLIISGDLGPETGNIRCTNAVEITGCILDGYELHSDSNILVRGTIGAAKVKSDGNLEVMLGIVGRGKNEIFCGGDLFCKFMQESVVKISGNLYVDEFIIRCEVDCEQGVYLNTARRASIIAGRVSASHTILANTVGSLGETGTKLQVGVNPKLERQYETVLEQCKEIEKKLLEKKNFLKHMDELSIGVVTKKDGKIVEKKTIDAEISELVIRLEDLQKQKDLALKKSKEFLSSTNGVIRVNKLMYRGTTVSCGCEEEKTQTDIHGPFFCELNKTSKTINFKGIQKEP